MKKILIYEDGKIGEYEVQYEQVYMDACLEEYKKKYSYLRKGNVFLNRECSKAYLLKYFRCFNEIISFSVLSDYDEESPYVKVDYVGSINPVVYDILCGEDGMFSIDNEKMYTILTWCEAINYNGSRESFIPRVSGKNGFSNLDEVEGVIDNISSLLSDVTLHKVGECVNPNEYELFCAKKGLEFVNKFGIRLNKQKELKK